MGLSWGEESGKRLKIWKRFFSRAKGTGVAANGAEKAGDGKIDFKQGILNRR
jgi:hypothetical protein